MQVNWNSIDSLKLILLYNEKNNHKGVKVINKNKLQKEGEKWVNEGIISEEQLEQILKLYTKKDLNDLIILFAVILTSLSLITFIYSDWAQVPHFSRILVMIGLLVILYVIGDNLYRKRSTLLGIGFITLGYIVFGAGIFIALNIYNMTVFSAWPFIIWSMVGLFLYVLYNHPFLFVLGIAVTTIGQIYSGSSFSEFNFWLLIILFFGFAHFVYHRANRLFSYLFAVSFSIHAVVLVLAESQQYYWLIVYFLVLYVLGDWMDKRTLHEPLKNISLLSAFILSMYQSFLLQENYFMNELEYETIFFVVWFVLVGVALGLKWQKRTWIASVDFLLFLPLFILPIPFVFIVISLFLFSIFWLVIGYKYEWSEKVMLGTTAFLFSTFTVYIQYAWNALNKSLFFLIGGLILFLFGFLLEKRRRALVNPKKGGTVK